MLSSKSLRFTYRCIYNGKGRPPAACLSSIRHVRYLGSLLNYNADITIQLSSLRLPPRPTNRGLLSSTESFSSPRKYSPILQQLFKRYASTAPTPVSTPPATSPLKEVVSPPDDWTTSLNDLASSDYIPIEQIGYLKQLGLDYGWGPTAFIETILEYVHIYSATPWWGSILLTALLVRVALFRLNVLAADQAGRLAIIDPIVKPIRERINEAKAKQDTGAMMLASGDLRKAYSEGGFSFLKMSGPFVQIPLGFGTFRLMRGMADLPVPGLDTGGLLWLQDLTVPDPWYLLPVLTAAAFHYSFKVIYCSPAHSLRTSYTPFCAL